MYGLTVGTISAGKKNTLLYEAKDDKGNPSSFGTHLLYCSDPDAEAVCDRSILPEDEKQFADWLIGKAEKPQGSQSEFRAGAYILRCRLNP